MQIKEALGAVGAALGWTFILASVPAYLFYWRVSNEPGAGSAWGLLITTILFLGAGGLLLIGGNIYLEGRTRLSWLRGDYEVVTKKRNQVTLVKRGGT
jgi:hypothetical protein